MGASAEQAAATHNISTCGSSRLEAECSNDIPELLPTEASQGSSEDDALQGVTHGVQGVQDFWGVGDDDDDDDDDVDEGSHTDRFMAFEVAAEEVRDLTTPHARPGHALKDFEVRGLRRPHRKAAADQISKGVLSIDLARAICCSLRWIEVCFGGCFQDRRQLATAFHEAYEAEVVVRDV